MAGSADIGREDNTMKWKCTVCGYVHEGDSPPEVCPVCGQPKEKFEPVSEAPEDSASQKPAKGAGGDSEQGKRSRSWVCTVCGYVHEGDAPPDNCPVCGKPWSVFIPDVKGPDGPTLPKAASAAGEATSSSKKRIPAERWRCVLCNHIHEGLEPPDVCPVCGAGKDSFVAETASPKHHHQGLPGLIEKLHLHPVAAHFPNGALPLSLFFWGAYWVFALPCLERASLYLMLAAAVAAPVTALTGWSDARHRFGTTLTGVFPEKKVWSWVLVTIGTLNAGWRLLLGWDHVPAGGMDMAIYSVLLLAGTAAAARLGMLGGKLVFGH